MSKLELHLKGKDEWLIEVDGINLDYVFSKYIGWNLRISSTL